jgi:hypothetical protein
MYSIFHTSHCGSTLLSALLSKSVPTLNEPLWSHTLKDLEDPISAIEELHLEGTLVKYSSVYCRLMNQIEGKKVFLYRGLASHVKKLKDHPDDIAFHFEAMKDHLNGRFHNINVEGSDTLKCAILWADRCFSAIDSKDVLSINADDLFEDPQRVAKKVCRFFEVEYVPTDITYNVKEAGLNHTDQVINLDNVVVKNDYTEPVYADDLDLRRWAEEAIVSKWPRLKYFI